MRAVSVLPLAVTAALASAAPAAACSIGVPSNYDFVQDPFDEARLAFTGRVVKVRYLDREPSPGQASPSGRRYEATLRVRRVYKGDLGRVLRVRASTDEASCGYGTLRTGQRVGLYVFGGRKSPFPIALGSGVSYRDLEKASGGRSHRPGP